MCNHADMITDKLTKTAESNGQKILYRKLDVTKDQAIPTVVSDVVPQLRYPVRGLVSCAGVSDNDPAHEFSIERFRRLMEINVTGTFAVAQAVALEMKKADVSGSIVLVASMSGTVVNKVRHQGSLLHRVLSNKKKTGSRYSRV